MEPEIELQDFVDKLRPQIGAIKARADKDARRMGIFVAAVVERAQILALYGVSHASRGEWEEALRTAEQSQAFLRDAAALMADWAEEAARTANPKRWSFSTLFRSQDPFRQMREDTRAFAKRWGLTALVEAMG